MGRNGALPHRAGKAGRMQKGFLTPPGRPRGAGKLCSGIYPFPCPCPVQSQERPQEAQAVPLHGTRRQYRAGWICAQGGGEPGAAVCIDAQPQLGNAGRCVRFGHRGKMQRRPRDQRIEVQKRECRLDTPLFNLRCAARVCTCRTYCGQALPVS